MWKRMIMWVSTRLPQLCDAAQEAHFFPALPRMLRWSPWLKGCERLRAQQPGLGTHPRYTDSTKCFTDCQEACPQAAAGDASPAVSANCPLAPPTLQVPHFLYLVTSHLHPPQQMRSLSLCRPLANTHKKPAQFCWIWKRNTNISTSRKHHKGKNGRLSTPSLALWHREKAWNLINVPHQEGRQSVEWRHP